MNPRLLYVVLAVQLCFAAALLSVGWQAREQRKLAYLERAHRITSGTASNADFQSIHAIIPERADTQTLRSLLGVPVQTASTLSLEHAPPRTVAAPGEFWIYPIADGTAPAPAAKLSGVIECYVLHLDETGKLANTPDSHGFVRLRYPLK